MPPYARELEAAERAANVAAALLREGFHAGFPETLDTAADREVSRVLTEAFPDYGYRSEELKIVSRPRDAQRHLWLVDPQDGTDATHEGFRGAAVSIALLRGGVPVLGLVYAYCAPDDAGDLFCWTEGGPLLRNRVETRRAWPAALSADLTALISQHADRKARLNAELLAPMRFRGIPGIAYRLALVAAGEGDVGISLNGPTGWDVAGGHALLRGAGGDLFDARAQPVAYDELGTPSSSLEQCYGTSQPIAAALASRDWSRVFRPVGRDRASDSLAFLAPGRTISGAGILSRAQGCLLGQFSGDALGALVEFQTPPSIERRYPGGPRRMEDGGHWNTIAGQPTDDSELALALARTLIARSVYDRESVARAYASWYDSHPYDIGNATRTALSPASAALRDNRSAADAAEVAADPDTQANGALMRISPLGIFGASVDSPTLLQFAKADATLTHPHPNCCASSAVFAASIAFAIRTGRGAADTYEFALQTARATDAPRDVRDRLAAAGSAPPPQYSGWVLHALQNAFYRLLHSSTLEEAIVDTIRAGGDTDTNAAITGALLGAVHGRGAISAQWRDRVLTCRPIDGLPGVLHPRPPFYWPVDALALAERLLLAGTR